jgi:1-acyl-sn-glycerol-3-phosphate acyltransferase
MVATKLPFNEIGLIAAKDYFFDKPEFFFVKHLLNLVPIARGKGSKALKDSIERSRVFLASGGKALIIYPEGTRSLGNNIAKFKEGAAILAYELNLPIVPAFISGSRNVLPKGSYMLRPKPLSVSFGSALKVCDFIEADASEERRAIFHAYREATAELERRVQELQEKNNHVV